MLSDDKSLVWVKDENSGGYPLHIAVYHVSSYSVLALQISPTLATRSASHLVALAKSLVVRVLDCDFCIPASSSAAHMQLTYPESAAVHCTRSSKHACLQGLTTVIEWLLQTPNIIEQKDGRRDTPVVLARRCGHNHIEQQLLAAGAKEHPSFQATPSLNPSMPLSSAIVMHESRVQI